MNHRQVWSAACCFRSGALQALRNWGHGAVSGNGREARDDKRLKIFWWVLRICIRYIYIVILCFGIAIESDMNCARTAGRCRVLGQRWSRSQRGEAGEKLVKRICSLLGMFVDMFDVLQWWMFISRMFFASGWLGHLKLFCQVFAILDFSLAVRVVRGHPTQKKQFGGTYRIESCVSWYSRVELQCF